MSIPFMGNPHDAKTIVDFLQSYPNGVQIEKENCPIDSKLLDNRRLQAYKNWGMIIRGRKKMMLTQLGKRLANCTTQQEEAAIFAQVLFDVPEYHVLFDKIIKDEHYMYNGIAVQDVCELIENCNFYPGENNQKIKEGRALRFLKVCEAAAIGTLKRKRLENGTVLSFNQEAIKKYCRNSKKQNELQSNGIATIADFSDREAANYVPLIISFADGRQSVLLMPQDASQEDAQYVSDMIKLMLEKMPFRTKKLGVQAGSGLLMENVLPDNARVR